MFRSRRRGCACVVVVSITAFLLPCTGGCGAVGVGASGAGDLGVTTGGQQDMAAARKAIEAGGVPDPASITVEGFLSEHSIPVDEPPDAGLLYATASVAWNRDFDTFTPLATVQIGFGTTLDPESFERSPLNLVIVLDRSGSMADLVDGRSGTSKLDAVKIAIDRLMAQLTAADRVSIVSFNTLTSAIVEGAGGDELSTVKTALDGVEARSGTDLVAGLRRGYRVARDQRGGERADRLMVFTDALLTASNEDRVAGFLDVMEDNATDGIGATIFGVGVDFGHEVALDIAQVRGGNYFFLGDYDRIVSVLDEEFDFLVSPIAYDVDMVVSVPFAFDVVDVYGIPVEMPFTHEIELSIPTLFLSNRQGGGAVLVRVRAGASVDFGEDSQVAAIDLSFTTVEGDVQVHPPVTAVLPAGLDPNADERYFGGPGTRRAVLLLNTALVLQAAAEDAYSPYGFYGGPNPARAVERLTEFLPYFDALAEGLEDRVSDSSRRLTQERALVEQLLSNLQGRF